MLRHTALAAACITAAALVAQRTPATQTDDALANLRRAMAQQPVLRKTFGTASIAAAVTNLIGAAINGCCVRDNCGQKTFFSTSTTSAILRFVAGLVGVRADLGDVLVVQPSADPDAIAYFALDNLLYHGRDLAVTSDPAATGKYGCPGLCVYLDGDLVVSNATPPLNFTLPPAREAPVVGGRESLAEGWFA